MTVKRIRVEGSSFENYVVERRFLVSLNVNSSTTAEITHYSRAPASNLARFQSRCQSIPGKEHNF